MILFLVFVIWLTIGDVRKCTDEEHITYSGGKEIFDLLRCGWKEKKDEKEKKKERDNINKYNIMRNVMKS